MSRIIFDAHLDLSMNAMEWNRDLTQPIAEIRRKEKHLTDYPNRGKGTVSLAEMRKGNVGICVATTIAPYAVKGGLDNPYLQNWNSQEQAWAQTQAQLAWYKTMEDKGELRQIKNMEELNNHIRLWETATDTKGLPIGYILSLEGADSIIDMQYLEKAYHNGLRAIGPAHYGPGVYAYGTDSTGGLGEKGRRLLKKMEQLNMILDTSHLCDESFWEALDCFHGAVWASHNNCRAIVPDKRQYSDEQIMALIERKAVIGTVLDAPMLIPGWVSGKSTPEETNLSLENVVQHIDHVCQLAGNSLHAAIGSDLDGGFGKEESPKDLDTIADLQKIPQILKKRGYKEDDIDNIMYKNGLRFLTNTWQ